MLRNRIFVGVAPLIILWMMVGGYAVWLFFQLGNAVNNTLHENYTSIAAMRDLKEAAGRIERTLSDHHDGGSHRISEQARPTLEQQAAICRRNVEAEMGIITESSEREAAERLRACDDAFLQTISSAFIAGNIKAIDLRRPLNDLLDAATTVQGINEQAMTEKDQHDLAMQVDEHLPPVAISADQLSHVFSNLISNAAKHSPTGEEIVVAAKTEGYAVRFSVTDHGPRIPTAERERIFEKFYRLQGETREGAGLGLAICREIVRAHDGQISVTNGPDGRGSEFFFLLPAAGI